MTNANKSLDDYDIFGPDPGIEDPYAFYELVREASPAYREPRHGAYLVTGYDDIVEISRNTDVFSSLPVVSGPFTSFTLPADATSPEDAIREYRRKTESERPGQIDLLITNDPPDHTEYRSLVGKLFTPKRMREVEGNVAQLGNQIIDEFVDAGKVEFVYGFADAYPVLVLGELLGIPREEHAALRRIVQDERGEFDSTLGTFPAMVIALVGRFSQWFEERRADPRDDILSDLAAARLPNGSEPSVYELVRLLIAIFFAGQETTSRLLTNSALLLATRPELADRVRREPGLTGGFVDEMLRWAPPGPGLFRLAKVDAEVAGVKVPAASIVWLLGAAANRDPAYFPDPTTFDLERPNAKAALSFGHGPHFCIGASLARAEGRCGVEALLRRLDDIQIDPEHPEVNWTPNLIFRRVEELNLTFK